MLAMAPLVAIALMHTPGLQEGKPGAAEGFPEFLKIESSTTKWTANLPSGSLAYTVQAAQLPLRNDDGDEECRMFYAAYTKDGASSKTRPVTFCFNGGPGSATIWLHMGGLAPKMAPMHDDGSFPAPPYSVIDNPDSWLDFTDLVFVDAPGCGFSRIAKPELGSQYFGVQADIRAFTNFVKGWLTEHHRWDSPLFIAGESYGGIRGSGLSGSLFDAGIALSGFISISGTSNFMTLDGMRGNDYPYIGFFPTLAATAWYHHRLAPKYKSAEQVVEEATKWLEETYVPALSRGDSLSASEKDAIASKMSELIGIRKEYILGANLRVSEFAFFRELLRDKGLMIGRYDGRLTGPVETASGGGNEDDPSDQAVGAPFTASLNGYVRTALGVETKMPYLNFGNVYPWTESEGSYSETASALRGVIARNPYFRVLYACSYFDMACPFYATKYTVNHMGLNDEARSRVSYAYYPSGHMMYIEKGSRHKLHDDVSKFVGDTLAAAR
jgi:carboxypeptidase C (cathepsin A)